MSNHHLPSGVRAFEAVRRLCDVSHFVPATTTRPVSTAEIGEYLSRGARRLSVITDDFAQLGYQRTTQPFLYRGLQAINALFSRGRPSRNALLFVAHHDYLSGIGAEDNGSGLALMLELARGLRSDAPNVVFASFDLEELGLIGSRNFTEAPLGLELKQISGVVALECLGSGEDMVICREVVGAKSDAALVARLERAANRAGYPIHIDSFDWFNSDHVPFAERGIPTVELCSYTHKHYRGRPDPESNVAHSDRDLLENIRPATLAAVDRTLLEFVGDFS